MIILTQYMVNDSSLCLGNEPVNTLNTNVQASLSLGHPSALYGVVPLALVVQMLDSAIHRINHYPADKY